MSILVINDAEKQEIKSMMQKQMLVLAEILQDASLTLENSKEVDDDIDTCWHSMKIYKHLMSLSIHLYNPDLTSYTCKDFWNNDTSVRDGIWDILEMCLSKTLFEKVEILINRQNGPKQDNARSKCD